MCSILRAGVVSHVEIYCSQGAVYLCGHLHTLMGLVPRMYTAHSNGNLELELGDWMDNRR